MGMHWTCRSIQQSSPLSRQYEVFVNRKKLIAGLVILGVLFVLVIGGIGFLISRLRTQPRAQQRELITKLVYCNSQDLKPCIVSFSLDADRKMLVNLVIPSETYPDFYLTISNSTTEASFKMTGKRVFAMAPLHHHFEQKGWKEPTIVIRFWIIAFVLALIGLSTLKLR